MARKKTSTKRKKSAGFDLKPYLYVLGGLLLVLTIFVGFKLHLSERRLIPISILAIIIGAIFEGKRIIEKWKTVFFLSLASFILSYLAFLPGKGEHGYGIENHIEEWPYWFIGIFSLLIIAFNKERVTVKLTEGITLIQSIAIIYWVFDYGFLTDINLFLNILMFIGLCFTIFAFYHAFTRAEITRSSRLSLSIWSSIIMMLFAIDNIYRVYQNGQIENSEDITSGFYISLQYFLLGVCCIYIIQNLIMLIGFLPGKGTFFNRQYFKELEELKKDHVKRYSQEQVKTTYSLICLFVVGTFFWLNYNHQFLPRNIAVWLVFVIFPIGIIAYEYAQEMKKLKLTGKGSLQPKDQE
ncbi:MAG: hypothetical protein Q8M15_06140 [Bacteroidota bacterium]|nr:hypothetical protein [Bacteroidota bacterium]